MERRLKWLKARALCPKGHEVTVPIHPLERLRYLRSDPTAPTFIIRCTDPACGCDVKLTAGVFQKAA